MICRKYKLFDQFDSENYRYCSLCMLRRQLHYTFQQGTPSSRQGYLRRLDCWLSLQGTTGTRQQLCLADTSLVGIECTSTEKQYLYNAHWHTLDTSPCPQRGKKSLGDTRGTRLSRSRHSNQPYNWYTLCRPLCRNMILQDKNGIHWNLHMVQ